MKAEKRAIDKIFKRRDRYEIPDWQRSEVWDRAKKQRLIDSILRGWKLPKFYFVAVSDEDYLVEDGQQRLVAIFDFFSNGFPLSVESAEEFGGALYRNLPRKAADSFDDFEIEYDIIDEATDEELKEFFQRLQAGVSLNSSEKLNAVHSRLRDFCRTTSKHAFFSETIAVPNTRYAHFDIMAKVAAIEIEGLSTGLRLEDVKKVFVANSNFSPTSSVARRIKSALDFLQAAFKHGAGPLRTRTMVQSMISLACKIVATGKSVGQEQRFKKFVDIFTTELTAQIEMGSFATDTDYLTFQHSVNANVKGGAKTRQEILLRKLFRVAPELADIFDPSIIAESGVGARITQLGTSIVQLVDQNNKSYSAVHGEDLFKATNKTAQALVRLGKPINSIDGYKTLIDDLYFLFHESGSARLGSPKPSSFTDLNELRTDLRHDLDHGATGKARAKRRKVGNIFSKYSGGGTPETIEPAKFQLVQSNILSAVEGDLKLLLPAGA
jgi:Protein of unknown function DUF262